MNIEKQIRPDLEVKKQPRYSGMAFFEADKRFSKLDLDIWPEGKLDKDSYTEKLRDLEERGFQEYFPQITLTRTEFQSDAKFLAVQDKDPREEAEKVSKEIEKVTGKKWQMEVIIETYDQNKRKMRIFIREKYCHMALVEIADQIKQIIGEEKFKKAEQDDNFINGVYLFLKNGNIEKARAEFKGQHDKFENYLDLDSFLSEAMFDDEILSPKATQDKWRMAMLNDD